MRQKIKDKVANELNLRDSHFNDTSKQLITEHEIGLRGADYRAKELIINAKTVMHRGKTS